MGLTAKIEEFTKEVDDSTLESEEFDQTSPLDEQKPVENETEKEDAKPDKEEVDDAPQDEQDGSEETEAQETTKEEEKDKKRKEHEENVINRLKREKEALLREKEDILRKQQEKLEPKRVEIDDDPEPNKEEDYEAHLEWKIRQMDKKLSQYGEQQEQYTQSQKVQEQYKRAINNFILMEGDFSAANPDYEAVSGHLKEKIKEGIQILNPNATPRQIEGSVANQILQMAEGYARKGLNPVEELYSLSKERYGYEPTQDNADTKEKRASVNDIAANKKKSITSLKGGDSKRHNVTMQGMTPGKLASLSAEQRAELIAQENK